MLDPLIGTTVAHYRIVERLGAGGMGQVYGARDTKLGRSVALKMLPEAVANDPDRLARFQREARLLAVLNHPNIAQIYGIENDATGIPFLVLERLEGETLAAHLHGGPLPLIDALTISRSIALALEAAHEKGIVHRDLKPENVMVAPSGTVKVLDFGVARWIPKPGMTSGENATTMMDLTKSLQASLVGTPAYMSPEQIQVGGEDERTDVFAFGCILFETVAGQRAFPGANAAEGMAAVLYGTPGWSALPPATPPPLRHLLERCLEKDPEQRARSIVEVRAAIESLVNDLRPAEASAGPGTDERKRHNLPATLSSFVGRRREISACLSLLDQSRLVTLTGFGGCGKSRLMLRVGESLAAKQPDGVWFVDLAPLTDDGRLAEALAASLGLREGPGERLGDTLIAHLRERSALILLDNCEHLLRAVAEQVEALLRGCERLRILATSREPIHVEGERVFHVEPLSLPGAGEDPEAIGRSESARLFVERAAGVRPGFKLDRGTAPIVADICRRLDGIPLALELAAARMRVLTVGEIHTRLDHRFRLLRSGSRTGRSRHHTLHATIQWSHDMLAPEEQQLFRGLSVFAGGWTLEAAAAVSGLSSDEYHVLDLLTALTEKSLVNVMRTGTESRYRFLETVRQYALERLQEGGEEAAWRTRHLRYMRDLAERAEPELIGPDQEAWFERLETERENLIAAHEWCDHAPEGAAAALAMAGALWRLWWYSGRFSLGQAVIGGALALDRAAAPTPARAQALYAAAQMARELGQYDGARELFLESLDVAQALDDPARIARAYNGLGNTAEYAGDYAAARSYHEKALALSRQIGNRRGVAIDLHNLAIVLMIQKDFTGADPLFEEALAIFRSVGDVNGAQATVTNLATIATETGRFVEACAYFEESFRLAEGLPSQTLSADSLESFAVLAISLGASDLAALILGTADEVRRATGYTLSVENRGVVEQTRARARNTLGPEPFATLDAEGRATSFEDAVHRVREWLEHSLAETRSD